jgi:hypothetical protein
VNEIGTFRCVCKTDLETEGDVCVPQPTDAAPCLTPFDYDYGPHDFVDGDEDPQTTLADLPGTTGGPVCAALGQVCVGQFTASETTDVLCAEGYSNADQGWGYTRCSFDLAYDATSWDEAYPSRWECADTCPAGAVPAINDGVQTGFCVDQNECTAQLDGCIAEADCIDEIPGYSCCCKSGYVGDGDSCIDADTFQPQCQTMCQVDVSGFRSPEEDCLRIGQTFNGIRHWSSSDCSGAYEDTGFYPDSTLGGSFVALCGEGNCPAGTELVGGQCIDVNECLRDLDDCGAHTTCKNLFGTYECLCDLGYSWNGTTCVPIDENEPQCAQAGEVAFEATGNDYCEVFGRTCTGLQLFDDEGCGANMNTTCNGLAPADCCTQSIDDIQAATQLSGLWTCSAQ